MFTKAVFKITAPQLSNLLSHKSFCICVPQKHFELLHFSSYRISMQCFSSMQY